MPKFFEINEIKKIRKEFKDDLFQYIVEFYILTGARLKEALVLTWDNIDKKRKIITIPSIGTKAKKQDNPLYSRQRVKKTF